MLFRLIPREIPRTKAVDWIQRPQPKMSIWKSCLFIYMLENVLEKIARFLSLDWRKRLNNKIFLSVKEAVVLFSPTTKTYRISTDWFIICVFPCAMCVCIFYAYISISFDGSNRERRKNSIQQKKKTMKTIRPVCQRQTVQVCQKKR